MVANDSLLGQYLRLETPVGPVTRRAEGCFREWSISHACLVESVRLYACTCVVCTCAHIVRDRRVGRADDDDDDDDDDDVEGLGDVGWDNPVAYTQIINSIFVRSHRLYVRNDAFLEVWERKGIVRKVSNFTACCQIRNLSAIFVFGENAICRARTDILSLL